MSNDDDINEPLGQANEELDYERLSIDINREMSDSFLEYAMSVIVSRALPDVRDGLKPVQRRIVYSMFENGLTASATHRKSATVVGSVMGDYHPHSNDAIYDALVRMGQDFSLRNPLIDPQGNFGTPDDPPGAMRYTECRLTPLANALLDNIKEDTVDFEDNYSGESSEPKVLPARFPNLLVNGSTGIAVGMATNMAPHNLGEVTDAIIYAIDNPDARPEEFLDFIKGPDFPTGGYILGNSGIRDALMTGRGSIKVRAVTDVQEVRKGRTAIVVTELAYQTSADRVIRKVAELVNDKRMDGVADIRNESSSRVGTRIVIELKRDAIPQVVSNQLFKMTPLQDTFSVNNVTLVDGVPRTLNVGEMIGYYVDHQMEVIERRTQFRLTKARDRAHIVEGLVIAVDSIDEAITIIRGAADTDAARQALIARFELSDLQANAILEMQLRRLTGLAVSDLRTEHAELTAIIEELEGILGDPGVRRQIIKDELTVIRDKHAEPRRSRIIPDEGNLSLEDLIADDDLIVSVTDTGYVKSVAANVYRSQGRGGRGVKAAEVRGDDLVTHLLHTSAHAYLLFFTNRGKVHRVKAHEIPRQSRTAKGVLAQAVLPLEPDERIEAVVDTRDYKTSKFMVIITKNGVAKKTPFSEYDSRQSSLIAINLQDGDEVVAVRTTNGENDMMLFTREGMGIRFAESDLRPMGRATQGVRGIKLREGDVVVGAASNTEGEEILLITTGGYGKRTKMNEYRSQKRGGLGLKALKLTKVRGTLVGARAVNPGDEVFVISSTGVAIRTEVDSISRQKREASGVKVIDLSKESQVAAIAKAIAEDDDKEIN